MGFVVEWSPCRNNHTLQGGHSTLFTYGQTGSGKTYTIEQVRSMVVSRCRGIGPSSSIVLGAVFCRLPIFVDNPKSILGIPLHARLSNMLCRGLSFSRGFLVGVVLL